MSVQTLESMRIWIIENAPKNPTLSKLSDYLGYSPYYCSVKFREYTGMTLKKYIAKKKLEYACEELKNTDDRIMDIAVRSGYSSHEAFTRAFLTMYCCTPAQYRKKILKVRLDSDRISKEN